MVLLCYDHHENVKQIEINDDSGSEDSDSESRANSDDIESESLPKGHKVVAQKGLPMGVGSVLRWTQELSSQRIFELLSGRRWHVVLCAVLVVGVGVFIAYWLYL